MKQAFILTILALLIISSISFVSAKTMIAGQTFDYVKTYEQGEIVPVGNATVSVNCTHDGTTYSVQDVFSNIDDGNYYVEFPTSQCDEGDLLKVSAVKGELKGFNEGIVHDSSSFAISMDLGIVNVPLIPEFGLFVGALTIVSAVGIFFFVRKH